MVGPAQTRDCGNIVAEICLVVSFCLVARLLVLSSMVWGWLHHLSQCWIHANWVVEFVDL